MNDCFWIFSTQILFLSGSVGSYANKASPSSSLQKLTAKLVQIDVGSDILYGINSQNEVFSLAITSGNNLETLQNVMTSVKVGPSNFQAKRVSVKPSGNLWTIDTKGSVGVFTDTQYIGGRCDTFLQLCDYVQAEVYHLFFDGTHNTLFIPVYVISMTE